MIFGSNRCLQIAALAMTVAMGTGLSACQKEDPSMMMTGAIVRPGKDIVQLASGPSMTEMTTFVMAIKAAGLVDTLKGDGPFTVFAPTNEAFAALPKGTLEDLLKPENKAKLRDILLYHIHASEAIHSEQITTMNLTTAEGKTLNVSVFDGVIKVNDARIVKRDIVASNGVIHWIDRVLIPQ